MTGHRKLCAEDVAFIMESREQGFRWKTIAWAFGMPMATIRNAFYKARDRGLAGYPLRGRRRRRAEKSPRSESLYAGTEGSYTSPPGNGQS